MNRIMYYWTTMSINARESEIREGNELKNKEW
jgi:hypothetical protein